MTSIFVLEWNSGFCTTDDSQSCPYLYESLGLKYMYQRIHVSDVNTSFQGLKSHF